jgi:hypothetical protein
LKELQLKAFVAVEVGVALVAGIVGVFVSFDKKRVSRRLGAEEAVGTAFCLTIAAAERDFDFLH